MNTNSRPYAGQKDQAPMKSLVHLLPSQHLHVIDLPYRFSSWAFDAPENIRLWFDHQGQLLAYAVLQTPFWSIDIALSPQTPRELYRQVLQWSVERASVILNTPYGHPAWFVYVFTDQAQYINQLEALGFANQAQISEDPWSKVFMLLNSHIQAEKERAILPEGFILRPLNGPDDVLAYVRLQREVFESENMTEAWRLRTLQQPDYHPELDLVIQAPDGMLAAFCVGWFSHNGPARRHAGQIEPMGVNAAHRGLGLGRALLSECIRRLYQHGAEEVYIETDRFRDAAMALYKALGFKIHRQVWVYRKDIAI